jgi:hypothetical protein
MAWGGTVRTLSCGGATMDSQITLSPSPEEQYSQTARIDEALRQVLSSAPFHGSTQCRTLLRYIVENCLKGDEDVLKERTIGIEVFGRRPDYNTAEDPIVRARVGEVRKRLAQYYQSQEAQVARVQILIPPGSYRPTFVFHTDTNHDSKNRSEEDHPQMVTSLAGNEHQRRWAGSPIPRLSRAARRLAWGIAITAVCALASVVWIAVAATARTELDFFWEPIIESKKPVLIYTGTNTVYTPSAESIGQPPGAQELPGTEDAIIPFAKGQILTDKDLTLVKNDLVPVGDILANVDVATLLTLHHRSFDFRSGSDTSFIDLRKSPMVLIGAYNNHWTMDVTQNLTFYFDRGHNIREHGGQGRVWPIRYGADGKVSDDYAIVSRLLNSETEGPVIVIAGIQSFGTRAAGEFVTDLGQLKKLRLGKESWHQTHFQLVLHTTVINGVPSSADVVASRFW